VRVAGVECTAQFWGLAIDFGRQKLYYSDQMQPMGRLGEMSTDGTVHRVLIAVNNSYPASVVIDDVNRCETIFHNNM